MALSATALKRAELRFRMMHRQRDLIGEDVLSLQEFEALVSDINEFVGDSATRLRALCDQYPATVSAFLVHCSLYGYAQATGNFWTGVWEWLEVERTNRDQKLLGETFLKYIRNAGLARVDSARRRYVDQILLHTPIPLSCMSSFFSEVVQVLAEQPEVTVDDLGELVEPVQQFIDAGDRVAHNVISRSVELYLALRRNGRLIRPALDNNDDTDKAIHALASEFNLPRLVVRHMLEWYPRRAVDVGNKRRVRLCFDPYDVGVILELRQRDRSRHSVGEQITIRCGDSDYQVDLRDRFPTFGSGDTITIPVPAPAEKYEVQRYFSDHSFVARGIELNGPTYFDPRTGRRLGYGPLPAGDVWVLAPKGWTVHGVMGEDSHDEGSGVVVEHLPPLHGHWRQFQAIGLNTKGYKYLQWLDENDEAMSIHDRGIEWHDDTLPRLVDGRLWEPWLSAPGSSAVYVDRAPRLWLPISKVDEVEMARWSIRCMYAGESEQDLFHCTLDTLRDHLVRREGGVVLDLEAPRLLEHVFGELQLVVHGPLGLDAHFNLTVIRGMEIRIPEPHSSQPVVEVRVTDADKAPDEVLVDASSAQVQHIRDGEKVWRIFPAPDTKELVLSLYSPHSLSDAVIDDSKVVATVPIRLLPAQWNVLELDLSATSTTTVATPSTDDINDDGGSGRYPQVLRIASVDDLATKAVAFRTYLSGGCRHEFTLLADGRPVQRIRTKFRTTSPQRSRIDLSQFGDTIRANRGAEFELQATIISREHTFQYTLAQIQFDWQIRGLVARLHELEDNSNRYFFEASWEEISPPRVSRKLLLEDRWRGRVAVQLDIGENTTKAQVIIPSDSLPPGRYTVAFVARGGWRREARRPGRVVPEMVLEVGKSQWYTMLGNPRDTESWLLSLNAHADGAWRAPKSMPEPEAWDPSRLALLGRTLARSAETLDLEIGQHLRTWPLEQRMRLVDAARTTDGWTSNDLRALSQLLGFPRLFTPTMQISVAPSTFATWPALLTLAGLGSLPKVAADKLRYFWGYLYQLQDPREMPPGDNEENVSFHPERPAMLLRNIFDAPQRRAAVRKREGEIEEARRVLSERLPRVARALTAIRGLSGTGLSHAIRQSQRWLSDTFNSSRQTLKPSAKLAFVCAAIALLQRAAAYQPELQGVFERNGIDGYEFLCTLCPELYDYYLLLAEASIRHLAAEEVA